jgi:hypothetical protein
MSARIHRMDRLTEIRFGLLERSINGTGSYLLSPRSPADLRRDEPAITSCSTMQVPVPVLAPVTGREWREGWIRYSQSWSQLSKQGFSLRVELLAGYGPIIIAAAMVAKESSERRPHGTTLDWFAPQRPLSGSLGGYSDRPKLADCVEKLLSDMCRRVFRGPPTINRVTIVDPGPF